MSYADQEEKNKVWIGAVKNKISNLIVNAGRSLGDAKRDSSGTITEQHLQSIDDLLEKLDCADFARGKYTDQYLQEFLSMEMSLAELVGNNDPPRYERLTEVLQSLGELLDNPQIIGNYRETILQTQARLQEQERLFSNSQVNVDDLDHAAFYRTVEVLKGLVLTSVESIVDGMDHKTDQLIKEYNALVLEQLAAFEKEAILVNAASPARMRPSKPEDDEDPWQVSKENQRIQFESPILQQYMENEEASRAIVDYDEEWYQRRRKEVGTVLPRASKVALEVDEHFYAKSREIISKLVENAEERLNTVESSEVHTEETKRETVGGLHQHYLDIVAAGEEFQSRKRVQREKSERDLARIAKFVEDESRGAEIAESMYSRKRQENLAWLAENETVVKDLLQQVIALQQKIVEASNARKSVSDELVELHEKELQRRSDFAHAMQACENYKKMLDNSMQNFLLPEGYSHILAEFAADCESLAKQRFESFEETLRSLKVAAVDEHYKCLVTDCLCSVPLQLRKECKVFDLKDKASVARDQRNFCISTKDPLVTQHETTEAEIQALIDQVEATIPPLAEDTLKARKRFDDRYQGESGTQLLQACRVDPIVNIDDLIRHNCAQQETYIVKGPRPPIVNLDFNAKDRVVVPAQYIAPHLVDRAAKAQNAQRTFA